MSYSAEFKANAIVVLQNCNNNFAEAAQTLGVSSLTLRAWSQATQYHSFIEDPAKPAKPAEPVPVEQLVFKGPEAFELEPELPTETLTNPSGRLIDLTTISRDSQLLLNPVPTPRKPGASKPDLISISPNHEQQEASLSERLEQVLNFLLTHVPERMTGNEWGRALGILIDRWLLVQGRPTQRIEALVGRALQNISDHELDSLMAEAEGILSDINGTTGTTENES